MTDDDDDGIEYGHNGPSAHSARDPDLPAMEDQGAGPRHSTGESGDTGRRVRSAEHRARISAAMTGRTFSPETRARLSASLTGRRLSPEHRANISAGMTGRAASPETRARMSAARKGVVGVPRRWWWSCWGLMWTAVGALVLADARRPPWMPSMVNGTEGPWDG